MAYMETRIYSGSSSRTPEELDDIVRQELVPQLLDARGLHRYSTIKYSDGRVGSYSVYEDREAADRGQQIASAWAGGTDVMRDYKLTETLRGEMIQIVLGKGNQLQRNACTNARIYKTDASVKLIKNAVDQEGAAVIQAIPGVLRWACVRLDDGRTATVGAFETPEAAKQLSEIARAARLKPGSAMGRIFPNEPETIEGWIIGTYIR